MPVFEPADESGHYAHILYIWKQGRLPNLADPVPTEKGVGYTTYPPLYYFSLIPLAKLIDAPLESEELLPYHPQKELFKKSVYAVYLHTKDELFFKWNSLAKSVHLLRLQTSLYGLLTVYLVYLTGKKVFGEKSRKPLLAAVLVGLNPMFAHISNSIVNVNLNILLFSFFFYLVANSLQKSSRVPVRGRGDPFFSLDCHGVKPVLNEAEGRLAMTKLSFSTTLKLNFVLGIIAGAAYLSKITGLVLVPIWGLLMAINLFRKKHADRLSFFGIQSVFFTLGFLTSSGWYLIRNYNLYGSLLETEVAIKYFGRPAMQLEMSGPVNYWTGFVQTNFKTFFSGYGMLTVNLPDKIVYLLALTAIIGVWGIILSEKENPLRSLLKGFSLIILFGHIIVNLNVEAFHARDLFIGMVPFSLLFVDGVRIWLKELLSGKLWSSRIINSGAFSIFLTISLFHFLQPDLVDFVKLGLFKSQISVSETIKLISFTVIFYILWFTFKSFSSKIAGMLIKISSGRNFLWLLAGGLFASNILILYLLVIPKLYQL